MFYLPNATAATGALVINLASTLVGAFVWAELTGVIASPKDSTANSSGSSSTPDSGNCSPGQASEILLGAVNTQGPTGDTAGTWNGDTTTDLTRVGTTGGSAASNVTLDVAWDIQTVQALRHASKTGITSRNWRSQIVTFKVPGGTNIACDTGSFAETGGAGDLLTLVPAGSGSFSLNGGDLFAPQFKFIALGSGSFSLTGGDAKLLTLVQSLGGSFALNGGDLFAPQFKVIPLSGGIFTETGGDAHLLTLIQSLTGAFSLAGGDLFVFSSGGTAPNSNFFLVF